MDFAALNSYGTGGLLEPANVDKETLLSWMLWVFSGFVSLGALASEVKDARTYIWAIAILIPVVLAMNTMPFVVSLSADATRANYDAGHFATVAESFDYGGGANGWLEWALQVGATCCYVGMYNGCFVLAERGLYFLCELHFAEGWRSGEPAAAARRGAGCSARWRAREGSTASSTRAFCSRAPPCRTASSWRCPFWSSR